MILMGFNPDQQEEEEEDPPAPSNSQSGPFISKQIKTKDEILSDKHGSLFRTKAGTGIQTHQVQMCRSFHRA